MNDDYDVCTERGVVTLEFGEALRRAALLMESSKWICYADTPGNNVAIRLNQQTHFCRGMCPLHQNDIQANFCSLTSENTKYMKFHVMTLVRKVELNLNCFY